MRVGELLAGEQIITQEQLETALQTQVMCGARLGTSLVELGYIDLDSLSNALGYQRGMPAALSVHFDRAERGLQLQLSPNLAEQYACIPLRRVGKRAVAVAVASPLDKRSAAIVADELGVDPDRAIMAIAPELRILYALERVYQIPRPQRFLRAPGAPQSPPRGVVLGGQTLPIDDTPVESVAPTGERRRYVRAIDARAAPIAVGPERARRTSGKSADETAALASIRSATDRKRVANLVIDAVAHLEPATEVVLLLIRRGTAAVAWSTYCRDGRVLEAFAVPLDQPGLVAAAFGSCELPRQRSPIDYGLLDTCGIPGGELVAEPVRANNHVVAALVVASFDRAERTTVAAIASAAGECITRLMREAIARPSR